MAIGIPEYRLPRDVLQEEIARILGGRASSCGWTRRWAGTSASADLEREGYRAIFLATGASKSRRLGVPGDELRGVIPATRFLKEVNLGESPRLSGASSSSAAAAPPWTRRGRHAGAAQPP